MNQKSKLFLFDAMSAVKMQTGRGPIRFALLSSTILSLHFLIASSVQGQSVRVGNGASALPAADRVGYAGTAPPNLAAALSIDYGYTEGVLDLGDDHHRALGRLAVAYTPIDILAFALRFDARYDAHSFENQESDDGIMGQSRLFVRTTHDLSDQFHLGGEAIILVPSGQNSADAFRGTSVDLNFLSSYLFESPKIALLSLLGFRLDNTAEAINHPDLMSRADRLALSVSETNALLLGIAGTYRFDDIELFEEWTWDIYLGDNAPSALASPIRLETGLRYWATQAMQLSFLFGISPSKRPTVDYNTPLSVVEPRFYVSANASYQISTETLSKHLGVSEDEKSRVWGRIVSPSKTEVAGANVRVVGIDSLQTVSDQSGGFVLENVPKGSQTLSVTAEKWKDGSFVVVIPQKQNQPLELTLEPQPLSIKGTVYSPSKEPIPNAKVSVGEGDQKIEIIADANGNFELSSIPENATELTIMAEGWQEQKQAIDPNAFGEIKLEFSLQRPLPEGQIRGYIRTFAGKPLIASIQIEPIGERLKSDEKGMFQIDVPPGTYRVIVKARGHRMQKHVVQVEHQGVTVLVVDLHRRR